MMISIIAAVAENNVIGRENKLIWHLPKDLKHFKETTTGHYIIQGRKTFESFGKPLPNRTTVIITRNQNYKVDGCIVVNSLQEALDIAINESEVFIIGGGKIYEQAMPIADRIYLTKVHHSFEGDTFFPEINMNEWNEISRLDFEPDEKNPYPFSIIVLDRKK
ncbi:MAG: dihydrofolate reductase [Bacteroidetes bacterium GWF2_33_16]|nr:MAG: dihydrofolate reductase [Bacteroidetes bacterium GWE2_32_14]OFY05288.1 MAG: dihydrofolate reductase [Bacteroidetes bacterium GWF2_33_16]